MKFWPFKRKAATESPVVGRSFSAAEVSALLGPWRFDGGFSNTEVSASLSTVRARSRDMAKNSEYFARWLQLYIANIVGPTGFRLKSFAEKSATDVSVDEKAAYYVETHWNKWASSPDMVDVAGMLDLPALLRLAVENWARDGEAFILVDRNAQNRYGISLRVVRPDCCDETVNAAVREGVEIRSGVEIDAATGRPIAYYFDASREDPTASYIGQKKRVRVPARDVIHLFTPHDASQVRGFPMGHPFLKKLKMLDEFDQAELVAARDEVNTLGIFTAPLGREGEIQPLAKDEHVRNRLEAASEPGQKIILKQGWTYDAVHPNHPNAGLPAFKTAMLRDIASGGGVEYANFANDWSGVSYSSVRAGTLAERDQWMTHQANLVSRVLDPLFSAWLYSFLSLRVSGEYVVADFDRLLDHKFVGRRWQWVDPMKDVQATVTAIQNGLMTHSQAAAEFGTDTDDNIDENGRISKAFDAAGLANPFRAADFSVVEEKDEVDDESV